MKRPIRILTAVPICDGHDSAILTINTELVRQGVEVIYLGYNRDAATIARAAAQERVAAVGISSYNGGHLQFFPDVLRRLRSYGAGDIAVFGGGGGTITPSDARHLQRRGVDRIFFAGTTMAEIVAYVRGRFGVQGRRTARRDASPHLRFGEACQGGSGAAVGRALPAAARSRAAAGRVVGITGVGGAGKSTLIDELALRFLRKAPKAARLAILLNDPAHAGRGGALLADRASMIYAQHDRIFVHSLASRSAVGGLSAAAPHALAWLRRSGQFTLILVESTGIGQEGDPFHDLRGRRLVDRTVLVMTPHYGGRLQLRKIPLLNRAPCVVLNKGDLPEARTAESEIAAQLGETGSDQLLFATTATRHGDPGVDLLFEAIMGEVLPKVRA